MLKFKSFDIAEIPQDSPQAFFPCMISVHAREDSQAMQLVSGKPLLSFMIERLRRVQHIEGIVVTTSINPRDDLIASFCDEHSLHCFRGSEEDLLAREYAAAESFDLEVLVRINCDSPFIDPQLINQALFCMRTHYDELDYLSNTLERSFPQGMDIEIIRFQALKEAFYHAKQPQERASVTSYITKKSGHFKLGNFFQKQNESQYKLNVVTAGDLVLMGQVFESLYTKNPEFDMRAALAKLGKQAVAAT
jgi:spore coat polysaccharide biosynthesis protein SpsF